MGLYIHLLEEGESINTNYMNMPGTKIIDQDSPRRPFWHFACVVVIPSVSVWSVWCE